MIKKVLIAVLLMGLAGVHQTAHAFIELPHFTHPKGKEYKIKRLVSQLYDKRQAVEAQRQLSTYGTEVTQYLMPVLKQKDDESAKIAALRIIAAVDDPQAEDQVMAMLKDRNHRVRQEAARTLSTIAKKQSSIEALKKLTTDYYPNVRYNAIRALARMAPEEDTDLFISVLGDSDPRIRMFAVAALGRIKSAKAVPYLTQMVRDYDPNVRRALVIAFANIGTQDCLQPIVWLMRDPDLGVRMLAVEKVGKMKVKGADEPLAEEANSYDPRVAGKAIIALADRKSPMALEIAKEHIGDEHLSVILASIEVVGRMGGKEEKPLLESLLTAESSKVRKQAQKALAEVNSRT
jgi:HEAT repeat protein